MYGKKHSQETIDKLRMTKSKYRVELYDLNNNLIKTFLNNVELVRRGRPRAEASTCRRRLVIADTYLYLSTLQYENFS